MLAGLNRRRAVITNTDALEGYFTIYAEVSDLIHVVTRMYEVLQISVV